MEVVLMENVLNGKGIGKVGRVDDDKSLMNLSKATIDTEYIIKRIEDVDEELVNFLFTLGCYEGERVTLISKLAENYVITVKDARYSIDQELAEAIII
jgi:ferrous iron transport protein A